jgi:acyl-CoA synthetase (AMP-forming)/AMP-acid ligase II
MKVNDQHAAGTPDSSAGFAAGAADAAGAVPHRYNFADDMPRRNLAAGRAGKPACIDPRGSWTYGALSDRVSRFGDVLRGLGIAPEQRILICLTDTIDWPTAFLGAIKAGIVAVPVNTLLTEAEYRLMLTDSRARLLVVSEELYPRFANLIGSSPAKATRKRGLAAAAGRG